MALTLRSVIFVVLVAEGSACDQTALQTCLTDLQAIVGQGKAAGALALCNGVAAYEKCLTDDATGCDAATISTFKEGLETTKTQMTGQYGIDCLKAQVTTTPELVSGDSGSPSGSAPTKSSSGASESSTGSSGYFLPWQLALLWCCLLCCCCGAIGGAAYAMNKKSKPKKPKAAPQPEYVPEAQPLNPPMEPIATVNVDVNHDGVADYQVTGVDANRDGIPDALQGDTKAPVEVKELRQPEAPPPMAPIAPVYEEPMPNLFGPLQPLMPGPMGPTTTSNYMPYPATTYPATTGYPATTYPGTYSTGAYGNPMASYGAGRVV